MTDSVQLCFHKHLTDAIRINSIRKSYYAGRTGNISENVSGMLIRNERLLLIPALIIDIRSRQFINKGIPIVCNDFIDMNRINPPDNIPVYTSTADPGVFENIRTDFLGKSEVMRQYNSNSQFGKISDTAYRLLTDIERIEDKSRSNFCMTKHVIESVGISALHAVEYSGMSDGQTDKLSRTFINIQISGLSDSTVMIDREAQKSQALNAGIICNDVPKIPFKAEYEAKNQIY